MWNKPKLSPITDRIKREMTVVTSRKDEKAIQEKGINIWKMGMREILHHEGDR
jgi:hypothetical protein